MTQSLPQGLSPGLMGAMGVLVRAALSKEIAMVLADPLRRRLIERADAAIDYVIDDWCGTPGRTHRPPLPLPGPRRDTIRMALALAAIANTQVQKDSLRSELMSIAARMTERAYEVDAL